MAIVKDLLVKILIENALKPNAISARERLEAVRKYTILFKSMKIKNEVVALLSTNNKIQEIFQIACILQGVNYIILNKTDVDIFTLVNLNVEVLLYDSLEIEYIPTELIDHTSIVLLVDALTLNIRSSEMPTEELSTIIRSFNRGISKEFDPVSHTIEDFKNLYVKPYLHSATYVQHPGVSTFGSKISVFYSESMEAGALKVIDLLYYEIRSKKLLSEHHSINLLNLETLAYPYVFFNSIFLALCSGGDITDKQTTANVLFTSVVSLDRIFSKIIDNSWLLSVLSPKNILFKLLFSRLFNREFKHLQLIILYGKTNKSFRRLLNYTGKNVIYMYTLIEVASFVSFELFKKMPITKIPTVGILPQDIIINSNNNEGEILLDTRDRFANYTNVEFTSLCQMSEKYVGMHGTLDIGKNVDGKLQILGKADEIFTNEHGLVIQTELITAIAMDNRYVKDCLVVVYSNQLVLLVELKVSTLLYEEKTKEEVELILSTNLLPKINKKVQTYSRISRIVVIPAGFERGTNGNIKHIHYTVKSINLTGN